MAKEEEQFELDLEAALPPEEPTRIGIVDADSIMFNLGWYYQKADLLNINDPGETDNKVAIPEFIHSAVDTFIAKLCKQMGVDTVHLHFTANSKNKTIFEQFMNREVLPQFRSTLGNTYKSNRKELALPTGYNYTLRALLQGQNAYIHDQFEADEAVILHKKLNPDWVLSSNDKDVYKQHFGRNWLYDKRQLWMDIDREFANYFAFLQAITGDPVDGFCGVPGIGPAKAETFVSPKKTPGDNWQGVLDAFKSKGFGEAEALMNMRFANMHQLTLNDAGVPTIDLWKPEGHHLEPVW